MSRLVSVALALVLVVAAVSVTPTAAATASSSSPTEAPLAAQQTTDQPSDLSPGQQLAGVLGVQAAELDGEVETRRFDHAVNRSDSNVSRAEVVAAQIDRIQNRLTVLRTRLAELERARDNGEISERTYRIRVARVVAELRSLGRLAERTETVSGGMPLGVLDATGVNVTAASTVRIETDQTTDGEFNQIATSVAGSDVGTDFDTAYSQDRARHLIKVLDQLIDHGTQIVDRSAEHIPEDNARAVDAIDRARRHLQEARNARDSAARALTDDNMETAITEAKRSRTHLRRAIVTAHKARRYAQVVDAREDRATRALEYAAESITKAKKAVARAEEAGVHEDRRAAPLLKRAKEHLSTAEEEYATARSDMDAGQYMEAMRHAKRSIAHSEMARHGVHAAVTRTDHDDQLTDRAETAIEQAERTIGEAGDQVAEARSVVSEDQRAASKTLESARDRLTSAEETLAEARAALEDDHPERALRLARKAGQNAEAAKAAARAAMRFAEEEHARTETPHPDRTESKDHDRTRTEQHDRSDDDSDTETRSD